MSDPNSHSPVVVTVVSFAEALQRLPELSNIYRQHGALILPGLFSSDETFLDYERDLRILMVRLMGKRGIVPRSDQGLDEMVTELAGIDRALVGTLYDIGTRPIKLVSGTRLKSHPVVSELLSEIFANGPIAYPYLGETLHVFPPGIENQCYNLPIHQDYPYLMQSSDQVTAYFNIGHRRAANVGGVRFWPGSHVDGISRVRRDEFGHWESVLDETFHDRYTELDYIFDYGDFALFNSLLQHSGIKNLSQHTRLFQLVRYSCLGNEHSTTFNWQSAQRDGRGVAFADIHPELVLEN